MFGKSLSMVADEMAKLIAENERLKADAELGAAIRRLEEWRAVGGNKLYWSIDAPVTGVQASNHWAVTLCEIVPAYVIPQGRGHGESTVSLAAAIDAALKQWEERE